MKRYEEMTMEEIISIVNRGGDVKTRLNKEVADYLDNLELSDKACDAVAETDMDSMAAVFGGLFTAQAVEDVVSELFSEDSCSVDYSGTVFSP